MIVKYLIPAGESVGRAVALRGFRTDLVEAKRMVYPETLLRNIGSCMSLIQTNRVVLIGLRVSGQERRKD